MSDGVNPFQFDDPPTPCDFDAMVRMAGHLAWLPSRAPNSTLMPALRALGAVAGTQVFSIDVGIGTHRLMRRATAQIALERDARVYRRDLPAADVFDLIDVALDVAKISRGAANRKTKRLQRRIKSLAT